jgi:hypothetical protein
VLSLFAPETRGADLEVAYKKVKLITTTTTTTIY